MFLYGIDKYSNITWKSNKLKSVFKNTLSAETLALKEAFECNFLIR